MGTFRVPEGNQCTQGGSAKWTLMKEFLTQVRVWLRTQSWDGKSRGGQWWEAIATPITPHLLLWQRWPNSDLHRGFLGCGIFSVKGGRSSMLVAQSCPTLCDIMGYSLPGSSVQGDSSGKNTGVGCHFLLQDIFPTQGLN